ncbi:MAG: hypothetical protein IK065_02250 [Neisseriaceae bacterium]|nr:hypothetical protein [Neisseriaceae bacterium]
MKYNELTPTAFWWVVLSNPTAGLNFCFSKDFAGVSNYQNKKRVSLPRRKNEVKKSLPESF